jgi:hypothetical protein
MLINTFKKQQNNKKEKRRKTVKQIKENKTENKENKTENKENKTNSKNTKQNSTFFYQRLSSSWMCWENRKRIFLKTSLNFSDCFA